MEQRQAEDVDMMPAMGAGNNCQEVYLFRNGMENPGPGFFIFITGVKNEDSVAGS